MDKHFVFFPGWVADSLKRRQLPLSTGLNFAKAREVLSIEDLAGVLAFQKLVPEKLFHVNSKDYGWWYEYDLQSLWENTARGEFDKKAYSDVLAWVQAQPSLQDALYERITRDMDDAAANESQEPFIMCDITPETAVMVINEGYHEDDMALCVRAVREIVKVSYVYGSTSEIASRSNWYPHYLRLLRNTQ